MRARAIHLSPCKWLTLKVLRELEGRVNVPDCKGVPLMDSWKEISIKHTIA